MVFPQVNASIRGFVTPEGRRYEWNGPEDGVFAVTDELLAQADILSELPWDLVRLGRDAAAQAEAGCTGITLFRRIPRPDTPHNSPALCPRGVEFK